jgi:hypothetical protein
MGCPPALRSSPQVGRLDGWPPIPRKRVDRTPPTGRLTVNHLVRGYFDCLTGVLLPRPRPDVPVVLPVRVRRVRPTAVDPPLVTAARWAQILLAAVVPTSPFGAVGRDKDARSAFSHGPKCALSSPTPPLPLESLRVPLTRPRVSAGQLSLRSCLSNFVRLCAVHTFRSARTAATHQAPPKRHTGSMCTARSVAIRPSSWATF